MWSFNKSQWVAYAHRLCTDCKPFISCDALGILTTVVDPVVTDKLYDVWCGVVGWCDPDNELISLFSGDGSMAVVTVGSSGELDLNDTTK